MNLWMSLAELNPDIHIPLAPLLSWLRVVYVGFYSTNMTSTASMIIILDYEDTDNASNGLNPMHRVF